MRSGHRERGIVEVAVRPHRILLEFGNRILAVWRLGLHHRQIAVVPVNGPPGVGSAGLQAGAAVKNNHHILAQVAGLRFLPLLESLASRNHQDDRHDAPSDAEHGQKGAQLVRPQGSQNVTKEICQSHSASLNWTRPSRESKPARTVYPLVNSDTYPAV